MKIRLLFATVVILISFAGCEREKGIEPGPETIKQMLGNWRLVQPAYNVAITLNVAVDQYSGGTASGIYSLKLTGNAPVNSYFTFARSIDWSSGRVDVAGIGTTLIGGSTEAMQLEQLYYASLGAVSRYELTDKRRLRFYHDGGVLVYEKTN